MAAAAGVILGSGSVCAKEFKLTTPIPEGIITPDKVETSIGTLNFTDARVSFHYPYTAVTPAMAAPRLGTGSDYGIAFLDGEKQPFDGGKTYAITLPPDAPIANFWAVTIYDTQTRSMLQTDQVNAGIDSLQEGLRSYGIRVRCQSKTEKGGFWPVPTRSSYQQPPIARMQSLQRSIVLDIEANERHIFSVQLHRTCWYSLAAVPNRSVVYASRR